MYDLILFDLDGTLTDPKEGITNCVKYALKSFGITETDEDKLMKFIGPPLYDSFVKLYGFNDDEANRAVAKYRERFSTIGLFENSVFADTSDTLCRLKNSGKTLALATSKPIVYAKRIIEKYDILKYFDIMVGAELDGTRGYKYEVIEAVLKEAKGNYKKAVMVGDRSYDIEGAKRCNIDSVGVRCGYAEDGELEKAGADYIFKNLTELCNFLIK